MKKMLLCIGLIVALTASAIPAFAGWGGELYKQKAVLTNQSTTSALSITTANVTAGRIVYAGAYKSGSLVVQGNGRTGLKNYSGTLYLWGSNDYTGSGTGGTWAPVATLTGTTSGQVAALTVPYKYYTVSYVRTNSSVPSANAKITATIYLYREQ